MNKGTGEKTTLEFVEAAMDAFGAERLRWLVGKGDVLIQNGQLTQEKFDELVRKTVHEEIERSVIERQLREELKLFLVTAAQTRPSCLLEKDRVEMKTCKANRLSVAQENF